MKKRVSVGRPGAANEDYQGRDERRRAAEREREELAKRAEYNQPDVKANRIKANAAMRRKLHAGFKQTVDRGLADWLQAAAAGRDEGPFLDQIEHVAGAA